MIGRVDRLTQSMESSGWASVGAAVALTALQQVASIRQYAVLVVKTPRFEPQSSLYSPALCVTETGQDSLLGTIGIDARRTDGTSSFTTAGHVVGQREAVSIQGHPGKVLGTNIIVDTSILECRDCIPPRSPERIGLLQGIAPRGNDRVHYVGAASGKKDIRVKSWDPRLLDRFIRLCPLLVYTEAATIGGDSGAALFDSDHNLVGFCSERTSMDSPFTATSWVWASQVLDMMEISI